MSPHPSHSRELRSFHTTLNNVLAGCYPTESSIRTLVVQSGLSEVDIVFAGSARDQWRSVIEEAHASNRTPALIEAVLLNLDATDRRRKVFEELRQQALDLEASVNDPYLVDRIDDVVHRPDIDLYLLKDSLDEIDRIDQMGAIKTVTLSPPSRPLLAVWFGGARDCHDQLIRRLQRLRIREISGPTQSQNVCVQGPDRLVRDVGTALEKFAQCEGKGWDDAMRKISNDKRFPKGIVTFAFEFDVRKTNATVLADQLGALRKKLDKWPEMPPDKRVLFAVGVTPPCAGFWSSLFGRPSSEGFEQACEERLRAHPEVVMLGRLKNVKPSELKYWQQEYERVASFLSYSEIEEFVPSDGLPMISVLNEVKTRLDRYRGASGTRS